MSELPSPYGTAAVNPPDVPEYETYTCRLCFKRCVADAMHELEAEYLCCHEHILDELAHVISGLKVEVRYGRAGLDKLATIRHELEEE